MVQVRIIEYVHASPFQSTGMLRMPMYELKKHLERIIYMHHPTDYK
jgi:hypothetical protein